MVRYSIRDNLRTLTYERSYERNGQPVVFENKVVVDRINKTIPEAFELQESDVGAVPFYGSMKPENFADWEGLSQATFEELNLARTQPAKYAEFVRQQLDTFDPEGLTYKHSPDSNDSSMST
jgi:hypothetical protein